MKNFRIQLNGSLASINWPEVQDVFLQVGWTNKTPELAKTAFYNSQHHIFIFQNEQVIGFGRIVGDGLFHALVVDVVVRPDMQGKGIGRIIVNTLREQVDGFNFVCLAAAVGKSGFYRKLGWKHQKSAYIWPKDEQQFQEHCFQNEIAC